MRQPTKNIFIKDLVQLQLEMKVVKHRIKEREYNLVSRLEQLPAETVRAAVEHAIPAIFNRKIIPASLGLLKSVIPFLKKFGKEDSEKEENKVVVKNALGQFGLVSVLTILYRAFKK
jgi:hypothetical protein